MARTVVSTDSPITVKKYNAGAKKKKMDSFFKMKKKGWKPSNPHRAAEG